MWRSMAIENGHDGIPRIFIIGAWTANWRVGDRASVPTMSGRLGNGMTWELLGREVFFHFPFLPIVD
jgi:hypothetical protein